MSKIFRYFEFCEEAEAGVAETTPEMSCDVQSLSPGIPENPELDYPGSMGRGKTLHRPGYYYTSPSVKLGTDLKIFSRLLYFVSGNRIVENTEGDAGAPDVSTEYIYVSDDTILPTFTGWFGIDIPDEDKGEFIIPGIVLDKLELSVENEFIMLQSDMIGGAEAPGTLKTKDELTLNDDYPLAFYEVNIHMRDKGSATPWGEATLISRDVKKFGFPIENSGSADDGQGLGSRHPYYIPVGERKVGLSFDYTYLTRKWYELMQGGTSPQATVGSTEFEMMVEVDAGDYGSVQIFFPRVIVTGGPVEAEGRSPVTQSVTIEAYQDTITVPTTPTQTVESEYLATFTHNFEDTTEGFDGPAIFAE